MKFEILNNISGAVVLITVTLAFSLLFEPRYKLKTYLMSLIPFLTILLGGNIFAIFKFGFAEYGKLTIIIATIPSLIYFFITSKNRDGRFLFTFCLVDTSSILFAIITGIIDYYIKANGLFNFIIRIAMSPIILFAIGKWGRKPYINILHSVKNGWWLFTAITAVAYALLIFISSYPVTLRERPDDIPSAILIAILLPFMYFNIFYVLSSQQKLHYMGSIEHAFSVQSNMMQSRAEEIKNAEENIKVARHDLRHELKIIEEFAINDQKQQLLDYLGYVKNRSDETAVLRYCVNPVLDAILSSYFRQAEKLNIKLKLHLDIPEELPIQPAEIATIFANALENAINATSKLDEKERFIEVNCISSPAFMFEIKNSFNGKVNFDSNGLPEAKEDGHGIGSKSVYAFCKKYDASYIYETKNQIFRVMISL